MSNYKTHEIAGISIAIIIIFIIYNIGNVNYINFLLILLGAYIGSLLPDLDSQGSYISNKTKPFSTLTNNIFTHRGMTHSLIFWMILNIVMIIGANILLESFRINSIYLVIGLSFGYLSHLLMDSLTKSGVKLFYPFL